MNSAKFIGIVGIEDINKTVAELPWQPLSFGSIIPYRVVNPTPNHFLTVGSGNISLATTSFYGYRYVSGIDVFRFDGPGIIDVDHYFATPMKDNTFIIYKTPVVYIPYHHLKPTAPIINNLPVDK